MKKMNVLSFLIIISILIGCSKSKLEAKGFFVSQAAETEDEKRENGIAQDSLKFETRPSKVLLTGIQENRLTTIYKVNYNKKTKKTFIGSNNTHRSYIEPDSVNGNQWHHNYMPGLEAVYGYNMVNISHNNIKTQKRNDFFESPVLIKTLYYPSFTKDTLNFKAVTIKRAVRGVSPHRSLTWP